MANRQPIPIQMGLGGINSSPNTEKVPVTDLSETNTTTYEDDTIQKEGGASKINTTVISGTPKVIGAFDFWPNAATQKLVAVTSDGKIITVDTGGIAATLKTGLGTDKQPVIFEGYSGGAKKLFVFNGTIAVQVWDGSAGSTTDLATPPADWTAGKPTAGCVHRNKLFGWGNTNFPHTLYYSVSNSMEDLTGAGSGTLNVYPGESDGIVTCISFLGRLFIFKRLGLYVLNDSDPTAANWTLSKISGKIGMVSPLAWAMIENDVMFFGTDGFPHVLSGITEFGEARSSAIMPEKILSLLSIHTTPARYNRATAAYYPMKRWWMCALSEGGTVNNRILKIDIHDPANPKYGWSDRDVCEALAMRKDSGGIDRPIIGDDAGFVWELDKTARTKDGAAYSSKFATKQIPVFPGGAKRAVLHELELVVKKQPGEFSLDVDVEIDGRSPYTVNFSVPSNGGFILDSSLLDTGVLGGDVAEVINLKRKLYGDGRRVKLTGQNNIVGQNYSIDQMILWASQGGERMT